jgi:peptidoglycan/xylan/chitin deacetylase (PgdA/CDA1 family)
MTGPRRAARNAATWVLLPLSLLPLYLAVPKLTGGDKIPVERQALDAPAVKIPLARIAKWRPLRVGPVPSMPVLAYHGINDNNDHYSISQSAFAEQMEMLEQAGFQTVGIEQYMRFLDGDYKDLPKRPILITFDDGRLDSYRGADRVLAKHDFKAVMFVIAGNVGGGRTFYLDWAELRRMMKSGRWDVQEHAGSLHTNVRVDAAGHVGPAYANRRWIPGIGLESFAEWRRRVTQDIRWGKNTIADHIPTFVPWTFALPFGDYGEGLTNDERVPRYFRTLLMRHFKAAFVVDSNGYTTPLSHRSELGRMEVHQDLKTSRLYRWLAVRRPAQGGE